MFTDPILALIGAIGVVIKTLITKTVLFSVEIVANICIAQIVVVLICFLHPILPLPHWLLSLSKNTPALIPCQYQQSIRVPPPQSIYPSNTQMFIDTPHSYGLLHHLSGRTLPRGPSSNLPSSFRGNRVDAAQISFRELVDGLEGFFSDSVLAYRRRHRIANRHGVRRSGQDAGSPPVHSLPNVRRDLFSHRTSFHWISTLGRLNMARIRAR